MLYILYYRHSSFNKFHSWNHLTNCSLKEEFYMACMLHQRTKNEEIKEPPTWWLDLICTALTRSTVTCNSPARYSQQKLQCRMDEVYATEKTPRLHGQDMWDCAEKKDPSSQSQVQLVPQQVQKTAESFCKTGSWNAHGEGKFPPSLNRPRIYLLLLAEEIGLGVFMVVWFYYLMSWRGSVFWFGLHWLCS